MAELKGKVIESSNNSDKATIIIDSSIPFWSSLDRKAKVEIIIFDDNYGNSS
ncbi:MAG: hypothetical protein AB4372_06750 [Xenococcus sp. (in: cyanobacteria)]